MRFLKQSTAVDLALGPFLDATDGVTAETGLTISQADVRLKKNAGAWAQKNDANAATHEENGWYETPLNTTDTDTLGVLMIAVHESGALPVWHEFMVVPANVYDSLFSTDKLEVDVAQFGGSNLTASGGRPEVNTSHIAGSAVSTSSAQIGVNVVQVSGDATAADNAEAFFDGTGYAGTNNVIPTVTSVTNAVSANVTQISGDSTAADNLEAVLDGTGGVTLVASAITLTTPITANATQISGDSGAADNAEAFFDGTGYAGTNNVIPTVTSAGLSAAAVDAIWDEEQSGHTTAGTFGKYLDQQLTTLLTTAMTEAYAADGATMTVAQALYEIAQSIGEFSISGTTLTVKKRDGSTTAATYTLNDSSSPTSRTRAS